MIYNKKFHTKFMYVWHHQLISQSKKYSIVNLVVRILFGFNVLSDAQDLKILNVCFLYFRSSKVYLFFCEYFGIWTKQSPLSYTGHIHPLNFDPITAYCPISTTLQFLWHPAINTILTPNGDSSTVLYNKVKSDRENY